MVPTLGRIVHFVREGGREHLAAIITKVHSPLTVNLCVFEEAGTTAAATSITYAESGASLTWHWPPGLKKEEAS